MTRTVPDSTGMVRSLTSSTLQPHNGVLPVAFEYIIQNKSLTFQFMFQHVIISKPINVIDCLIC